MSEFTEKDIEMAKELAEIDSFYIEEGYVKEKTSRRLDVLHYFRFNNKHLWNGERNWLTDDINQIYYDHYFDTKYPTLKASPLGKKWIKILAWDKDLSVGKYDECANLFEEIDKSSPESIGENAEKFKRIIEDAKSNRFN